jgi:hypothetical protein
MDGDREVEMKRSAGGGVRREGGCLGGERREGNSGGRVRRR